MNLISTKLFYFYWIPAFECVAGLSFFQNYITGVSFPTPIGNLLPRSSLYNKKMGAPLSCLLPKCYNVIVFLKSLFYERLLSQNQEIPAVSASGGIGVGNDTREVVSFISILSLSARGGSASGGTSGNDTLSSCHYEERSDVVIYYHRVQTLCHEIHSPAKLDQNDGLK